MATGRDGHGSGRGHDEGPPNGRDDPKPLGNALDALMRSLRGTDRRDVGGVFGGWDDAVGSAIAAHVRPVRLRDKVLTVEVDDPTWATQVRLLHDDLVSRLAERTGVVLEGLEVTTAKGRRRR